MKYYPTRRTNELFSNDLVNDFFEPFFRSANNTVMKTDVSEKEDSYQFAIELPGYQKEDVKIAYDEGYLTVSATHDESKEEKDEKGSVIRRERNTGTVSRSYFIGKNLEESSFKASLNDGILTLVVPKEAIKKAEEKKYISID
ncbi:MAG: Hsp20/alpha crystallin family protein [Erysipelotrichaceae bacterium]|jgi:HSP20 family molecular chaperone IbpA|nr:Hsp20/alpha crystallin family protein [Erysipelotrichaceae bacterium]